jgi:hypothetical protein
LLMMIVVDERNSIRLKIIKTQVSKISQLELSSFSIFFHFSKNLFQNLVRIGVRGGAG